VDRHLLGTDTKSSETWKFDVKSGSEVWVGVGTENGFATGYGLKALLFGGPGNLSSGGSLVQMNFGPTLKTGDEVYMRLTNGEDQRVTVEFGINGYTLGKAFDISGWTGQKFRPVVSLNQVGDSLEIYPDVCSSFPTVRIEDAPVPEGEITGDWVRIDRSYKVGIKGNDDTGYGISAKVANSIFCTLVKDEAGRWLSKGDVGSTLMMPPPQLRVLEEEVGRRLSAITEVKKVGSNLMISSDGFDDHEFTRKARPSAATRDQVHWMN